MISKLVLANTHWLRPNNGLLIMEQKHYKQQIYDYSTTLHPVFDSFISVNPC